MAILNITALTALLPACGASLNEQVGVGAELAPQTTIETASVSSGTTGSVPDARASSSLPKPGEIPTASSPVKPVRFEGADSLTAVSTPGSDAYKIGPQDVLEVSVFKVPELSRSVQVADAGTINLPLVGEVEAAGKTARDVEQDLANKLGEKYLQSPQVTVLIKEYNSRRVTIEGAVRKPGIYPVRGRTTLLQFVSIAGGVTEASDTGSILVFRTADGNRSAAKFDLDEIRTGSADDPIINDGDVIVVNTSATRAAFQNFLRIIPVTHTFIPLL